MRQKLLTKLYPLPFLHLLACSCHPLGSITPKLCQCGAWSAALVAVDIAASVQINFLLLCTCFIVWIHYESVNIMQRVEKENDDGKEIKPIL